MMVEAIRCLAEENAILTEEIRIIKEILVSSSGTH
jgi:hypothetical protein